MEFKRIERIVNSLHNTANKVIVDSNFILLNQYRVLTVTPYRNVDNRMDKKYTISHNIIVKLRGCNDWQFLPKKTNKTLLEALKMRNLNKLLITSINKGWHISKRFMTPNKLDSLLADANNEIVVNPDCKELKEMLTIKGIEK